MATNKDNHDMTVLEAIATRFSVRRYTDEPVSDEQLEILLRAGFSAPSACNLRPWEFIVIRDRETLNWLADEGKYQKMLYQAPLAIVVCGDNRRSLHRDLLINDCSAAVQNILLAACGIGLGGCWLGMCDLQAAEKVRQKLDIPAEVLPAAIIAVGRPDEERAQPDRYAAERVHYERF